MANLKPHDNFMCSRGWAGKASKNPLNPVFPSPGLGTECVRDEFPGLSKDWQPRGGISKSMVMQSVNWEVTSLFQFYRTLGHRLPNVIAHTNHWKQYSTPKRSCSEENVHLLRNLHVKGLPRKVPPGLYKGGKSLSLLLMANVTEQLCLPPHTNPYI